MSNLTDLDRLRFASELRAFVASGWIRSAIYSAMSGYRSRAATPEERERIAGVLKAEAKYHAAVYRHEAVGLGEFFTMFDGMERSVSERSLAPLEEHDWASMRLLAEALAMTEHMHAAQQARLDEFRERGTAEDREQLAREVRAAKRDLRTEWGHPREFAPVMGDALRNVGRGGWWERLQHEIHRAAIRRAG